MSIRLCSGTISLHCFCVTKRPEMKMICLSPWNADNSYIYTPSPHPTINLMVFIAWWTQCFRNTSMYNVTAFVIGRALSMAPKHNGCRQQKYTLQQHTLCYLSGLHFWSKCLKLFYITLSSRNELVANGCYHYSCMNAAYLVTARVEFFNCVHTPIKTSTMKIIHWLNR